ncbi:selenocysteine-specific translation elongation factor [Heliobacillus mobilis]|uniref:Selenocysteine-specific elongation factor n=1 Tax=Heliobacterium mobile TaxID=28064 RepID=A0A6I3SQ84_HELMO|nr:selenocysteine-specific translation elongation factor [Heliobacterium mobile]MTV50582.1 selenocysteine-specific translation elongation factor [Heliobacterium mobile]
MEKSVVNLEDHHIIIGTAGHVDHGKTQLVKALTGVDTDRLKEEKERGISIELGFAPFVLPRGLQAGFVDVPGHERFIKQMVAGVSGMDLVMLIIAADEGIMPQTREHLDIIELLQVPRGMVVLTKADLVDEEWLELMVDEVKEFLSGTSLSQVPIIAVSSTTGIGLPELKQCIVEKVSHLPRRPFAGAVRLPIDRVFTVSGFGTVVTGTLASGVISAGDVLSIMPSERTVRVRGLQVHGKKVDAAQAGQRVAVNVTGVEVSQVERGDVLAKPGLLTPSYRISVRLKALPGRDKPLKDRERIRFHSGTRETLGRISLLDREELAPGEEAYAQIILEDPIVTVKGDRFVLRTYSPALTVGGGQIIEPVAAKLKKNRQDIVYALATKETGSPIERLTHHLTQTGNPLSMSEAAKVLDVTKAEIESIVTEIRSSETPFDIFVFQGDGEPYFLAVTRLEGLVKSIERELGAFHQKYPLRPGLPKEDLKGRLTPQWDQKAYGALLATLHQKGRISLHENLLARSGYVPVPEGEVARRLNALEQQFASTGLQPPTLSEVTKEWVEAEQRTLSELEEYLNYLTESGRLQKIADGLLFHRQALQNFIDTVEKGLTSYGELTVADVRNLTGSSRKYIVPLLEWSDRERVTRRVGDKRVAFSKNMNFRKEAGH